MVLTQTKYIKDLLSKVNMDEANGVNTPMFSSCKLSKHGEDKISNPFLYRSTWEHYNMLLSHVKNYVLCQCWSVVKHMCRYLSGTITHCLILAHVNPLHKLSLRAYSDLDWASGPDNRRSTFGSRVYFKPNLVTWSSKK